MDNYIYLLREREFIKTNENVFKLGKTTRMGLDRFKSYPKGSDLLLHVKCDDCHTMERQLIDLFKNKYKHRNDMGAEYFEGNYLEMMKIIAGMIFNTNVVKKVPAKSVDDVLWDKFKKKKGKIKQFSSFCNKRRETVQFDIDYDELSPLEMLKKYTRISDLFVVEKENNSGYLILGDGDGAWRKFEDNTEETLDGFIEHNNNLENVRNSDKRLEMLNKKIFQIEVDTSKKTKDAYVLCFLFRPKKQHHNPRERTPDADDTCDCWNKYREYNSVMKKDQTQSIIEYPNHIDLLILDFKERKIRGLLKSDMWAYDYTIGQVSWLDFTHVSRYECTHINNDLINPTDDYRSQISVFINLFISDVDMFKNIMYDIFDGKKGIYHVKRRGDTKKYGMNMLIYNIVFSLNIKYDTNLYHLKSDYKTNPLYLDTLYGNKPTDNCMILYDNIGCKDITKYSKKYLVIVNDNKGNGIDCNYDAVKELDIVKKQQYQDFQWDDTMIGTGIVAGILWWLVDNYDR